MISSVNVHAMKFKKVLSEHVGHTLKDIVDELSLGGHIFIHQLDPQSIDIDKVKVMDQTDDIHAL